MKLKLLLLYSIPTTYGSMQMPKRLKKTSVTKECLLQWVTTTVVGEAFVMLQPPEWQQQESVARESRWQGKKKMAENEALFAAPNCRLPSRYGKRLWKE